MERIIVKRYRELNLLSFNSFSCEITILWLLLPKSLQHWPVTQLSEIINRFGVICQ